MATAQAHDLIDVVDGLYDAALDQARWPDALHGVAEFTGGRAVGWVTKDLRVREGVVHQQYGADERYVELYRERYWRFDPLTPIVSFPAGQMVTTADVMPVDEFKDGPFYQEWARPQGFGEAINLVLHKHGAGAALLSLIIDRDDPGAIGEAKRRLSRVAGHVSRAVMASDRVASTTAETRAFTDALDWLTSAFFLARADGLILHANAAGRSLLDPGGPLLSVQGRLSMRDPKAGAAMASALRAAARGDAGSGSATIPLSANGGAYVAHVVPLTSGARQPGFADARAVAAVFVYEATMGLPPAPEIIARSHGLTPGELRVLMAIVESGGIRETADSLGLADTTVKTHLAHIYAKTGTSRQADLIKLVAGFASPLLS